MRVFEILLKKVEKLNIDSDIIFFQAGVDTLKVIDMVN